MAPHLKRGAGKRTFGRADGVEAVGPVSTVMKKEYMSDQPNFLMIMCDQLRADWLGFAGHPQVQTPNIDRLAGNGTSFHQLFCRNARLYGRTGLAS